MADQAPVRSPQLSDVIERHVEARVRELNVSIPARVETYDATTQKVSVKPLVKRAYLDEDSERQVESLPVVPGVPVAFPQAGGFRITFPVAAGDIGVLLFSQASLDRWLSGQGQEVDPEYDHSHDLTDGIFLPGVRPFGSALTSAPTDHMTIGADAGKQIHFRTNLITIGDESGAQFIALANLVNAELTKIATTLTSLTGASFTTPYSRSAVDATQAKAK